MAWIRTIPETEAEGELAKLYERVGNPDGTVDNVMTIHALNPETLRTHFEMYTSAMHRPSPLTRAEREMVAVIVSRLNGCAYCLAHHHAGLARRLGDDRAAVADGLRDGVIGNLTDRQQTMIAFAMKLTESPRTMAQADVQSLRDAGLDDRAILDLTQCIGYFNYVNRIVNGLGVKLGKDEGPPGQWPPGSDT